MILNTRKLVFYYSFTAIKVTDRYLKELALKKGRAPPPPTQLPFLDNHAEKDANAVGPGASSSQAVEPQETHNSAAAAMAVGGGGLISSVAQLLQQFQSGGQVRRFQYVLNLYSEIQPLKWKIEIIAMQSNAQKL